MIIRFLMKLDNVFILLSIISLYLVACSSMEPINTADSCIIFEENKRWYKATKKSYDKWNVPIALQLSIINQESSFKQFAKPKRKRFGVYKYWFKKVHEGSSSDRNNNSK